MHELSIARAVLRMVEDIIPGGRRVQALSLRAGAARAIEPAALEFAWRVACMDSVAADSKLTLRLNPWRLRCRSCGRHFSHADWQTRCRCGGEAELREADDQLVLEEVELAPQSERAEPMESGGRS